ncbi:MAG TPA: type II toxin-antitoxin system mRNA interferase toxin, RelE/StbE family [bacterium]|nr:type II toxin-antitoxin system mRNA interferase toxin, RelE/StbE family [bacterium]
MKLLMVVLSERAQRNLEKVPEHIESKLVSWINAIKEQGLEVVRRIAGYHDEPLQGARFGQRSIRLNRSYRAIYEVTEQGDIRIVEIKEVTKHEY